MDATSVPRWSASAASDESFLLAEGPLWDPPRQRLLWVDIDAGAVLEGRLDGDRVVVTARQEVDRTVGAVVPAADGALLVAGAQTLHAVGRDGVRRELATVLPRGGTGWRCNDAGCDPGGRFLVGTMALGDQADEQDGQDVLVRVESDGGVTVLDDDLRLSNGLAWSPDGALMYSIDSAPGVVWVRDYDVATGAVGSRRELLRVEDATPDGMCVDAEGQLWIAAWGAGQVRRFTPGGTLTGVVDVPAPHTSCPAFAGERLDRLVISTGRSQLAPEQLAAHPDSGRLFVAEVGVSGLPATPWAGIVGAG